MKKTLFFLFIFISANAQNKRTINLEIAGTLFSKINTEINNISDITLTGNINNEDIIVLRNMVQNGSLEYVDMFDSYIHGEGDEDNVIPEEAFKNCTNLKSIILPQKTLALGYESFSYCIYNHRTTKTNQKYPSVNL
ncbi:leucine-rich repeat domain-containing protein [Parabacteroides merdae]|nr:leucine-rich repeat domain-containing protein [Parabacteroides merdae]